jgi:hypothetical protein
MRWTDPKHRGPVVNGPRAKHDSGARNPSTIRLVVMHDTEGGTARSVAAYFASASSAASTHWVVDDKEAIRCLPDDVIPWGAPGANRDGIHIEQCGWARWTLKEWFVHQSTLKRSAWVAARACVRYGIPVRWLTDKQLAGGVAEGLTYHAQVSRVFRGSDHSDPGPNFPRGYFLRLVKRRVGWIKSDT